MIPIVITLLFGITAILWGMDGWDCIKIWNYHRKGGKTKPDFRIIKSGSGSLSLEFLCEHKCELKYVNVNVYLYDRSDIRERFNTNIPHDDRELHIIGVRWMSLYKTKSMENIRTIIDAVYKSHTETDETPAVKDVTEEFLNYEREVLIENLTKKLEEIKSEKGVDKSVTSEFDTSKSQHTTKL